MIVGEHAHAVRQPRTVATTTKRLLLCLLAMTVSAAHTGAQGPGSRQCSPGDLVAGPVIPSDFNLSCPATSPEPETDASTAEPPDGGGKRLRAVRVVALDLDIGTQIVDGNPLFFFDDQTNGGGPYPVLAGSTSIEQLDFVQLASLGETRVGVAADGVSQLVLKLSAPLAGTFEAQLLGRGDNGDLVVLRSGETCAFNGSHQAFVIYRAPEEFGRGSGTEPPEEKVGPAEAREVYLKITFTPAMQGDDQVAEEIVELKVVRPPVVLVHGLFDDPVDCWLTPAAYGATPRSWLDDSDAVETLPAHLERAGLVPFLVDYRSSNGEKDVASTSSFEDNRYVVWEEGFDVLVPNTPVHRNMSTNETARGGGIRDALEYYRDELGVAAAQADVIGHSMGGILARVNASYSYNPRYQRPDNFCQGDVNRLITVGTPHHGSELVEVFDQLTQVEIEEESWLAYFFRTVAQLGGAYYSGALAGSEAMRDLAIGSDALFRIGFTEIPSHVVVGVTREGGVEDKRYDETAQYLLAYSAVGAMFWSFPEVLEDYLERIAVDWQSAGLEDDFENARTGLEDLIESEHQYWLALREEGHVETWLRPGTARGQRTSFPVTVPYLVLETLRSFMFRFDKNDSAVGVDSQLGGLPLGSPYVTFVDIDPRGAARPDVPESVIHSYEPRYDMVQEHLVKVLKSGLDRFAEELPPAGVRQPAKRPREDLGIDWRVGGPCAAEWSAMAPEHVEAFKQVAQQKNTVIMVRPVNPDATRLISRGEATKSMNVKGKSSNWGPQKGYIPADQTYSKLWRTLSHDPAQRESEIREYQEKTDAMLSCGPEASPDRAEECAKYRIPVDKVPQNPEKAGQALAVTRPLELFWPPCERKQDSVCVSEPGQNCGAVPDDACRQRQRVYSVWAKPGVVAAEQNAEEWVFLCREGTGADRERLSEACACTEWFDWHTRGSQFDLAHEPTTPATPGSCSDLRRLEVLADNAHPQLAYLTADYDVLAIGLHCPEGASGAQGCQNVGKGMPPSPEPRFDEHRGAITDAQWELVAELNEAVENVGYTGGRVVHHGPENNFNQSPYVDYPITVFEPVADAGPTATARVLSIQKGPKGFRDLHLKRYFESRIRDGYWLYPNHYTTAMWGWAGKSATGPWVGWKEEDQPAIWGAKDPAQLEVPPCALRRIGNSTSQPADPTSEPGQSNE